VYPTKHCWGISVKEKSVGAGFFLFEY